MDHVLRIFAGLPVALQALLALDADARLYTLTPDADIAVLPFDDAIQDALHRRFGTGDWPEAQGIGLSTTDQAFAAECSLAAPLVYMECGETAGQPFQSAAAWQSGRQTIAPIPLDLGGGAAARPRSLWPVNAAAEDASAAFGLAAFACNGEIHARAWPLRR
jgi:hypothetical protein